VTQKIPVLIPDHARKRARQRGGDIAFLARAASRLAALGRIPKRGETALKDRQGCIGIVRYASVNCPRLVLVTVLPAGAILAPGTVKTWLAAEERESGPLDVPCPNTAASDNQRPTLARVDQLLAGMDALLEQLRQLADKD